MLNSLLKVIFLKLTTKQLLALTKCNDEEESIKELRFLFVRKRTLMLNENRRSPNSKLLID